MNHILLVDDDPMTIDTFSRLLVLEGYCVESAFTGLQGVAIASTLWPTVALIDLNLPDVSGLDVVQQIRVHSPGTACVVITGFGTCRSVVEAMRLGALDVVEKPLLEDELIRIVACACALHEASVKNHRALVPVAEDHPLTRWAHLVVGMLTSTRDLKTVHEWGRFIGVSASAVRAWCRRARQPVRQSLLFGRVLRAITMGEGSSTTLPEDLLDIADSRTLTKVIVASGGRQGSLPSTVSEFLARQTLITDINAIRVIALFLTSLNHSGRS